jgi:hypothetical protein
VAITIGFGLQADIINLIAKTGAYAGYSDRPIIINARLILLKPPTYHPLPFFISLSYSLSLSSLLSLSRGRLLQVILLYEYFN